jgi:hypothetical protein
MRGRYRAEREAENAAELAESLVVAQARVVSQHAEIAKLNNLLMQSHDEIIQLKIVRSLPRTVYDVGVGTDSGRGGGKDAEVMANIQPVTCSAGVQAEEPKPRMETKNTQAGTGLAGFPSVAEGAVQVDTYDLKTYVNSQHTVASLRRRSDDARDAEAAAQKAKQKRNTMLQVDVDPEPLPWLEQDVILPPKPPSVKAMAEQARNSLFDSPDMKAAMKQAYVAKKEAKICTGEFTSFDDAALHSLEEYDTSPIYNAALNTSPKANREYFSVDVNAMRNPNPNNNGRDWNTEDLGSSWGAAPQFGYTPSEDRRFDRSSRGTEDWGSPLTARTPTSPSAPSGVASRVGYAPSEDRRFDRSSRGKEDWGSTLTPRTPTSPSSAGSSAATTRVPSSIAERRAPADADPSKRIRHARLIDFKESKDAARRSSTARLPASSATPEPFARGEPPAEARRSKTPIRFRYATPEPFARVEPPAEARQSKTPIRFRYVQKYM